MPFKTGMTAYGSESPAGQPACFSDDWVKISSCD
jgi:hypothetical protein